jgi:serine/threonine protein kinase
MTLAAGIRLGPYEILAPLGAGGMGEVYKARDTRLDRTVAIKILSSIIASDPVYRARFEREAKAVAALSHPHICPLFDVGHQDGTDFLVMEFLEGETLAARLRRGRLSIDQAIRCAIEMADALDKAHRQGIVHRDLKPGNVMLTKAGVKLLDFGLAKLHKPIAIAEGDATTSAPESMTAEGTILLRAMARWCTSEPREPRSSRSGGIGKA